MGNHVGFVRRIYDEDLLDRDIESLVEGCDPDVQFVNPGDAIDTETRRGHEGLRAVGSDPCGVLRDL